MKKMKKLLTFLICSLVMYDVNAQIETQNQYYTNGSMSIGMGSKVFSDTSAWVHIGGDTTNKGIILPNVILDSIQTTKRGLFVYSLKDSVLYHFDDTNKVRYMTYRDTTMIKNLVGTSSGSGDINQGGNALGEALEIGTTDNYSVSVITNNTEHLAIDVDGKTTLSGASNKEDILTIDNGNTLKVKIGVGANSYWSSNSPFLCFGTGTSDANKSYISSKPGGYGGLSATEMGLNIHTSYAAMGNATSGLNIISKYINNSTNKDIISLGSQNNALYAPTTGTMNFLYVGKQFDSFIPQFNPSAGDANFNMMYIYGHINQSGTATGISRGLHINTYVQNAVDWRSLEIGVNSGYSIYQSGSTAKNYFNGNMLLGSTTDYGAGYQLQVTGGAYFNDDLIVKGIVGNVYTGAHPYLELKGNESVLIHPSNGNNGTIFLGLSGVTPDFNYPYSNTSRSSVYVNRDVTPVSGSANLNYNSIFINEDVDYTNVTGTNIYTGFNYNPTITGNVTQRGVALLNTTGWGIYQNGASVDNYFNGDIVLGTASVISNASTPNSSAIIDIESTTQGVLLTRMTTTQRNAITAVEGLEIYNTTTHKKQVYDGTTWQDCW